MAVPPRNRRAGKIEIENREKEIRDKLKERNQEKITPEEDKQRIDILRNAGIIK